MADIPTAPADNAGVVQVATPVIELTATAPQPVIVVPPCSKFTVPFAGKTPLPALPTLTVAVKVTVLPAIDGFAEEVRTVVVVAELIVSAAADVVLELATNGDVVVEVLVNAACALIVALFPAGRLLVTQVATPLALTACVPQPVIAVPPWVKLTVPAPATEIGLTVAVSVTDCPKTAVVGDAVIVVVVGVSVPVPLRLIDCVAFALPLKLLSKRASVPLLGPGTVGVKVIESVQDWPKDSDAPQVVPLTAKADEIVGALKLSDSLPMLLIVTVFVPSVVSKLPTIVAVGKLRVGGVETFHSLTEVPEKKISPLPSMAIDSPPVVLGSVVKVL